MDNYVLFKQVVCLIFFFETLWIWPRFSIYFGPEVFPKSVFTTSLSISIFQIVQLTTLVFLFLGIYPLFASFVLLILMRYLFVTDGNQRITIFGAVGHMCYLISAYLFFFELSFVIDSTKKLTNFIHSIFAVEVGLIMLSAGIYKYVLGYRDQRGFEYALVNPSWGKFFFLFKKIKPTSWFFKINNALALFLELASGLLFFIPETRLVAAYLLLITFLYVFLTVRVGVLSLLMMTIAQLYLQPIHFHFPYFSFEPLQIMVSKHLILLIKALFIIYLIALFSVTLLRIYIVATRKRAPRWLEKPMGMFMSARPFFEWNVFHYELTHFFIKIEKASKETKKITDTLYDGFSKNYREIFSSPSLFFRFCHHHESSIILNIFATPLSFAYGSGHGVHSISFISQMVQYAKTLLSEKDKKTSFAVFTVMEIQKEENHFTYTPVMRFFVDAQTGEASAEEP